MQIIYGQSRPARLGRHQWRNGRLFQAVEPKAKAVFLDGDYPAVRRAYEAAGVPVSAFAPDPLDHYGDGAMGGAAVPTSETKADIIAELEAMQVTFDPRARKDELAALRDEAKAAANG